MRSKLLCPKCGNNKILLVAAIPDCSEIGCDPSFLNIAAFAVKKQWLSSKTLGRAGHLEAVVCKQCGYTELYTRDPGAIPVDGEHVREVSGPAP